MKKIFLPLILLLFTIDGFAQFKGNPGKAKSSLDKAALKTDLNEIKDLLILAKGEIDAAIEIEKQRQKANTWLIRGDVYAAIAKGFKRALDFSYRYFPAFVHLNFFFL